MLLPLLRLLALPLPLHFAVQRSIAAMDTLTAQERRERALVWLANEGTAALTAFMVLGQAGPAPPPGCAVAMLLVGLGCWHGRAAARTATRAEAKVAEVTKAAVTMDVNVASDAAALPGSTAEVSWAAMVAA